MSNFIEKGKLVVCGAVLSIAPKIIDPSMPFWAIGSLAIIIALQVCIEMDRRKRDEEK